MYNEKEFLNTITSIEQSETSELLIAKSEIIIPESKILLLDDMQIETSLSSCYENCKLHALQQGL